MKRVFTSSKNRSQTHASNHLGSFRLDLNTASERGRDRDDGREVLKKRDSLLVLQAQMMKRRREDAHHCQ